MVLRPEKEAAARAVFDKWDLDFAVVGETIAEDRFIVRLGGEVKADLPLKALSGAAPEYDRPWVATPAARRRSARCPRSIRPRRCCALIGSPNLLQPRLGLAPVRPHGDGRHRGGARLGRRRGAGARHRQGDRLHLGRDPALLPRRPGARRHAGGGRGLAQPLRHRRAAAGGHRQPQLRQPRAARDHGPARRLRPRHRAPPAPRSTCRSSRATSASTTRPRAGRSCRRRPSARSACWPRSTS